MADPLPPGWTGNDAEHHIDVGGIRVTVYRPTHYNALVRKHQRSEWAHMRLTFPPRIDTETGRRASSEARRAALTALVSLLTTATREATEALAGLET